MPDDIPITDIGLHPIPHGVHFLGFAHGWLGVTFHDLGTAVEETDPVPRCDGSPAVFAEPDVIDGLVRKHVTLSSASDPKIVIVFADLLPSDLLAALFVEQIFPFPDLDQTFIFFPKRVVMVAIALFSHPAGFLLDGRGRRR